MNKHILRSALAAIVMCAVMVTSYAAPARANGTTNTIIGVMAGIAAIATAVNVEHKNQVANTVEGYLPDGSTVYQDGHVVAPNGYSWYPGNQGEQIACNNGQCSVYGNGQYPSNGYGNGYNGYGNGYNGYGNGYNGYNGYNGENEQQSQRRGSQPHRP
jgi:hypothetical protein